MMDHLLRKGRGVRRAAQCAAAITAVMASGAVGGCLNRPIETSEPRTTTTIVERFTQSAVDKIDLLLMIDNSRSMADKQLILADAVPDLVEGLVNPKCIDPNTGALAPNQPKDALAECDGTFKREFDPVYDIHIGIISSSLGGHGADACSVKEPTCPNSTNPTNNDAGHLISRTDSCVAENAVPTYDNKGFLAWDPKGALSKAGLAAGDMDQGVIVSKLRDMVIGVGQIGCGYEAQHESWYRFLIDPEPYSEIQLNEGKGTPNGVDATIVGDPGQMLLGQRADFLRPSSLLAIIMLTDENDCSIKEAGTSYLAAQQRDLKDPKRIYHLPKPRHECATDPGSPCCKSCGSPAPESNCEAEPDATCHTMTPTPLSDTDDDLNLRCFDQKRRFGFDFLYPLDRYKTALTSPKVPNRAGMMVDNPIFSDLNPNDSDSNVRDAGLVFIAGIVGVPWQLIARQDASGKPDLLAGLNLDKKAVGGFKTFEELSVVENGVSTWDKILGDPGKFIPPQDPHMIESAKPRAPLTTTKQDEYNGHEYTIAKNDDLQYACIFDLSKEAQRDCSMGATACDCVAGNDNPLCDTMKDTRQIKAKSYPGLRELALLKSVGPQGVVASVCPAQLDPAQKVKADYGYRPAIGAIIDRLKSALGGKCLPRQLNPDPITNQVQCLILEAKKTNDACACDPANARWPIEKDSPHYAAIQAAQRDESANKEWNCFCEIIQAGDPKIINPDTMKPYSPNEEGIACRTDPLQVPVVKGSEKDGKPADGWCYVDATTVPSTGNPDIVKDCAATEKRLIRFVGKGNPAGDLFITCSGGANE